MNNRGASEVIGFILITALVITGVTVILFLGAGDITNAQQDSEMQHAQNTLSEFDSEVSQVALNQDVEAKTSVELGLARGADASVNYSGDSKLSIMTVGIGGGGGEFDDFSEYENKYNSLSDCSSADPDDDCKADYSLGTLKYDNGEQVVAYEGGGVWKKTGPTQDASPVSSPEFHYTRRSAAQQTLTMPLITLEGQDGQIGSNSIDVARTTSASDSLPERLSAQTAVVRVESEYATGWEEHFRDEVGEENIKTVTKDGVTYIQFLALDNVVINTGGSSPLTTGEEVQQNYEIYMSNLSTDFNSDKDIGEIGTSNELADDDLPDGVEKDGGTMTIDEGGKYYADEINLGTGGVSRLELDAEDDGTIKLIVDGDVKVTNGTEIETIGEYDDSEDPEESKVGQIYIPDGEFLMERGGPTVTGQNTEGPEDDRVMQFFGTQETYFTIGQSSTFRGVIYNPGAGDENPPRNCSAPGQTNQAGVCMNSGVGVSAQGLAITGTADEDALDGSQGFQSGDIGDEDIVIPTGGDDNKVFFIHLSENRVELSD